MTLYDLWVYLWYLWNYDGPAFGYITDFGFRWNRNATRAAGFTCSPLLLLIPQPAAGRKEANLSTRFHTKWTQWIDISWHIMTYLPRLYPRTILGQRLARLLWVAMEQTKNLQKRKRKRGRLWRLSSLHPSPTVSGLSRDCPSCPPSFNSPPTCRHCWHQLQLIRACYANLSSPILSNFYYTIIRLNFSTILNACTHKECMMELHPSYICAVQTHKNSSV